MQEMLCANTPQELFESVARQLSNYTLGFMRIEETDNAEDAVLLGSGTLVEVDGIYGVLTAQHVIEVLPKKGEVGILLVPDVHRYTLPADFLKRITIARGCDETVGPDLAVLILPSANLGTIKALKSFYNLSLRRDRMLSTPPNNETGTWVLCGTPNALTVEDSPTKEFGRVKGFYDISITSRVSQEYWVDDYDYFEFEVVYNAENELPTSFQGMSGGGLWQVPLRRTSSGEFAAQELLLSGVAFYQSAITNNARSIKCHGRQSIYKCAIDALRQLVSPQVEETQG